MKHAIDNIKISDAMARIIKYEPFYGYLLQQLYFVPEPDVGTAGVGVKNGKINLWFNPEFIDQLAVEAVEVVLLHECGHLIRNHISQRFQDPGINHAVMNIAMDSTINPGLGQFKWDQQQYFQELFVSPEAFVGRMAQPGMFVGKSEDLDDYTAEELYNHLIKKFPKAASSSIKNQSNGGQPNNQQGNSNSNNQCNNQNNGQSESQCNNKSNGSQPGNGQGSGNSNSNNQSNQQGSGDGSGDQNNDQKNGQGGSASPRQQQPGIIDNHGYMKTDEPDDTSDIIHDAVKKAAEKSIGNMPKGIEDIVDKLLNEKPRVNWKKVLTNFIGSAMTDKRRVSITRVSKRYGSPFFGTRRVYTSNVVIGMDVSGSIGDDEVKTFLREIDGICKLLNITLPIIQGDTEVQGVDEYNKKKHSFKRRAEGGTDMQPIIDLAKKKWPRSRLILFTDGFIPPVKCSKKTLIVIPPSGTDEFQHDGGTVIKIPKEGI